MKKTFLLLLLLTGCSNYTVNTNLDKKNFTDYFAVSGVDYYQTDELVNKKVTHLGIIEGESCQENVKQPPPEANQAKIAAKRRAAELGANGVVIGACIEMEPSKQCVAGIRCFADAVIVTELQGSEATVQDVPTKDE